MSSDGPRAARAWAALVLVLVAFPAAGETTRSAAVELDPQRTVIHFTVGGALHETHGTFRLERGAIDVDPATGATRGVVVVDAASGDSGSAARDHRMRDRVLEADAHPEIEFRPARIDGVLGTQGEFDGTIQGALRLHGATHEIGMTAHGQLAGSDLTATCHFSIPYVAWGLTDPSVLFLEVAKEVSIDVSAVGHVQWKDSVSP
jgi:polyisoprenoid-binding protein YceI